MSFSHKSAVQVKQTQAESLVLRMLILSLVGQCNQLSNTQVLNSLCYFILNKLIKRQIYSYKKNMVSILNIKDIYHHTM